MLQKTNAVAVRTIGIDTGKNTLHLIGLDQQWTRRWKSVHHENRIVRIASMVRRITRTYLKIV